VGRPAADVTGLAVCPVAPNAWLAKLAITDALQLGRLAVAQEGLQAPVRSMLVQLVKHGLTSFQLTERGICVRIGASFG
jgi:hypothetical protein